MAVLASSRRPDAETSFKEKFHGTDRSRFLHNSDGGPITSVTDPPPSTLGTSASHPTVPPAQQSCPTTLPSSGTATGSGVLSSSGELRLPYRTGSEKISDRAAVRNKQPPFTKTRSPISGLLGPILKFMECSEVSQFFTQAETHPGLRSTKIFDLSWVLENLFDVHGGVRSLAHLRTENFHSY